MDYQWALNRLKSMSLREVAWRVKQKAIQIAEQRQFKDCLSVDSKDFYPQESAKKLDWVALGVNFSNSAYSIDTNIALLGNYNYSEYRNQWLAGFQTTRDWPLAFSSSISPSATDVPGDLRTNWELNRHHQFALLAKAYFVTDKKEYLKDLQELFYEWTSKNPFLYGPAWNSSMEMGIRLINWIYAAAFLNRVEKQDYETSELIKKMLIGCKNMAAYIARHPSKYSSANNHLIIEMVALGIAGRFFGIPKWTEKAFLVLDEELFLQNYNDGINKEQSLHYQLFGLEAYALFLHVCDPGMIRFAHWRSMLERSCAYVKNCEVKDNVFIEFGDNDDGSILYLESDKISYPQYVLALLSVQLDGSTRWSEHIDKYETIRWLYSSDRVRRASRLPLYVKSADITYDQGGVSIMRSHDESLVIAVDHGPLGFGSLAAHGHADALSIQVYLNGQPLFLDSGTFVYNGNNKKRNYYRSSAAHNTLCLPGKEQSEMLGPFMWGKKAESFIIERAPYYLFVQHNGYAPDVFARKIQLDPVANILTVEDHYTGNGEAFINYLVDEKQVLRKERDKSKNTLYRGNGFSFEVFGQNDLRREVICWSPQYGIEKKGFSYRIAYPERDGRDFAIKVVVRAD